MAAPRLPYPSSRLQYSASANAYLSMLCDERDDASAAALLTSSPASPSLSSFSSLDSKGSPLIPRSSVTDLAGTPSGSRKFYRSLQLGQPPLGNNNASTRKPEKSGSTSNVAPSKTAPLKELEKMIADLKKENFDLKLRLYHLEDALHRQVDIETLEHENYRLALDLQEKNELIRTLERALYRDEKGSRSVGTQTADIDATLSPLSITTSYYTAFETSPEAFGLTPSGYYGKSVTQYFDGPLDQILDAFQSVHIVSPNSRRRNDDHGDKKVRGWLSQMAGQDSASDDGSDKDVSPLRESKVCSPAFNTTLSCAKPRAFQ